MSGKVPPSMGPVLVTGWPSRSVPVLREALTHYGGLPHVVPLGGPVACSDTRAVLIGQMITPAGGRSLCRRIAATSPQPVLVVLSRADASWEITLLDAGAHDVVAATTPAAVIAARLNRHLAPMSCVVAWGNITCEPAHYRVELAGRPAHVSPTHFRILALLVSAGSAVVTRAEVASVLRAREGCRLSHVIDAHLCRLRHLLARNGASHLPVAVRGIGYRLEPRGA